jgi:predicted ATP-binding protein involved in virulence
MNDIAAKNDIAEHFPNKEGIQDSLFRTSEASKAFHSAYDEYFLLKTVQDEIFNFGFNFSLPYSDRQYQIPFNFEQHDFLPNRVNVIVGKNGSGKTQTLAKLSDALSATSDQKNNELFSPPQIPLFRYVIAVSFSAFDDFKKPHQTTTHRNDDNQNNKKQNNYIYCGIQGEDGKTLSLGELKAHSRKSLELVKEKARLNDWRDILAKILEDEHKHILTNPDDIFDLNLSSGQNIMLCTMTDVIANIENESLILFDEPELHLHPNAISSFIQMLYSLLSKFNSYAIICTHSPLIIQETPSRCITKLDRQLNSLVVSGLTIESFGENVSTIIEEVFNVKDTESNYMSLLKQAIEVMSYDEIVRLFPKGLSMNALTFLNILFNRKDNR